MRTLKPILYTVIASFLLFACENSMDNEEKKTEYIEISKQQFTMNNMRLGTIENQSFENIIKANGEVISMPNGTAKINAPINGIIKNVFCTNGQFVNKNQVLLEIEGVEILDLQKEFAIVSANLKRLKMDYNRVKLLFDNKALSEKEFIAVEAEYKAILANYNGLKLKLESVGISSEKIENGDFQTSYFLQSPIEGYISNLNVFIGTQIGLQNNLLEIVNPDLFQIKLSVFSDDIAKIKIGQQVRINQGDSNFYYGKIESIGVSFDENTKSIPCFVSLSDKNNFKLIENMFIESDIISRADTVNVLPKSALIKTETENYILVLSKQDENTYYFTKQTIRIGRENNDFYEILDKKMDSLILTNGGYYLNLNE